MWIVVAFSLTAFVLLSTSVAGYGAAFAADSVIILNEIELNPPINETAWVELYNPGASSFSLYDMSLLFTANDTMQNRFEFDPALIMTSGSYHVLYLPREYHANEWTGLSLIRGEEVLSEVSGISDPFADDRTWQRFPNAASNGVFEDWTFKKATVERYNGDLGQMIAECYVDPLCLDLDMLAHKTHPIRINGTSFLVTSFSTSGVGQLNLVEEEKKISLRVLGREGSPAFTHITFPKVLLGGDLAVYIDGTDTRLYRMDNETHSRIMLEYASGDRTIDIVGTSVIPEFSANAIPIISGIISLFIVNWRLSKLRIRWR